MCGCQNKVAQAVSIDEPTVTTFRVKSSVNCQDMTKVLDLIKVRDYYLNEDKLPESGEVTRDELIQLIHPLAHTINTNNACGNASIIEEYYDKLSVSAVKEVQSW